MDIGSAALAWTGKDQHGTVRSSSEFAGSWHVLYFYHKDDTPGCTAEACGFRDRQVSLAGRVAVVGISPDTVESHRSFVEKYRLPFTLVADPDRKILAAYGIGTAFPKRTTFLIDDRGIIRTIYDDIDCATHAAKIERDLAAFGL